MSFDTEGYIQACKNNTVIDFTKKGDIELYPFIFACCPKLNQIYLSDKQYRLLPSNTRERYENIIQVSKGKIEDTPRELLENTN